MTTIAIIGTAGRDKTKPMTLALWHWMLEEARTHMPVHAHVVSGGAAWADHLAVALFLEGSAHELTLHLPAPFDVSSNCFLGPFNSSGSTANYYHERFSRVIHHNDPWFSRQQITQVASMNNVNGSFEPMAAGYGGMFARNIKVAKADHMLAFTFGHGDIPADGGTKDTWDKCRGQRIHIPLPY